MTEGPRRAQWLTALTATGLGLVMPMLTAAQLYWKTLGEKSVEGEDGTH